MKRILWLTLLVIAVGASAEGADPFKPRSVTPEQATRQYEHRTYCYGWSHTAAKPAATDRRPLVWVLDGAGDLKGCSGALAPINTQDGSPLELIAFPWSHGHRRLFLDQTDGAHAKSQGMRLAREILERKAAEPGRRVVVIAHSAGCAVALAACDELPIDAVDRVILLAPSVSTGYDIRPTLWSAKEGVDVFCSKKDWVALGFVVKVVGTTDNFWSGAAAGRLGFKPKKTNALAELEAGRLRQHFWSPDVAWTGNTGGHHGVHAPLFVQTYLMPLMVGRPLERSRASGP